MSEIDYSKIKAVASDLDGTLIRGINNNLPNGTFEMIQQIQKKGIRFIAASGRQYANMRKIFAPIVNEIDYISENGCLAFHKGELVYKNAIEKNLAITLIDDLLAVKGTEVMISGVNQGYVLSKNQNYIHILRDVIGMNVKEVNHPTEIDEDMVKISILWWDGIPKEPEKYFHKKYDHLLSVANGGNGWLDFNNLGSGKGTALKVLANFYQLSTDEFMVFGDNENDITMLTAAGISYAVNSATDYVKSFAKYHCEDVLSILKEAFLTKKE